MSAHTVFAQGSAASTSTTNVGTTSAPRTAVTKVKASTSSATTNHPYTSFEVAQVERYTALILDNIGFTSASQSCLHSLSTIMQNYFELLCRTSRYYADYAGRETITFSDVAMAFRNKNVSLMELHDYILEVGNFSSGVKAPYFPVSEVRVVTNETPEPAPDESEPLQKLDKDLLSSLGRRSKPLPQKSFPSFADQHAIDLGFTSSEMPVLIKVKRVEPQTPTIVTQSVPLPPPVQVKEEVLAPTSFSNVVIEPSMENATTDVYPNVLEKESPSRSLRKKRKEKVERHKRKEKRDKHKSAMFVCDDTTEFTDFNDASNTFVESGIFDDNSQSNKLSLSLLNNQQTTAFDCKSGGFDGDNGNTNFSSGFVDTDGDGECRDLPPNLDIAVDMKPDLDDSIELQQTILSTETLEGVLKLKFPSFNSDFSGLHKSPKKEKHKKSKHEKKDKEQRKLEKKQKKLQKRTLEEQSSLTENVSAQTEFNTIVEMPQQKSKFSDATEPPTSVVAEQKGFKIKIKFGGGGGTASAANSDFGSTTAPPLSETDSAPLLNSPGVPFSSENIHPSSSTFSPIEPLDAFDSYPSNDSEQFVVKPLKISVGRIQQVENIISKPKSPKRKKDKGKRVSTELSNTKLLNSDDGGEQSTMSIFEGTEIKGESVAPSGSSTKLDNEFQYLEDISRPSSSSSTNLVDSSFNKFSQKIGAQTMSPSAVSELPSQKSPEKKPKKKSKSKSTDSNEVNMLLTIKSPAESLFDYCFGKKEKTPPRNLAPSQPSANGNDHRTKEKKLVPSTPLSSVADESKKIENKKKSKASNLEMFSKPSSAASIAVVSNADDSRKKTKKTSRTKETVKGNLEKEKKSQKNVSSSSVKKSKSKNKESEKRKSSPTEATPPAKRKKIANEFLTDTIRSEKKMPKSRNFSDSMVVDEHSSSPLSLEEHQSRNSDGRNSTSTSPAIVEDGDENIWICPVCSVAYVDGAADMVGCDGCDRWFHWHCVGLLIAPPENKKWFCHSCNKRRKKSSSILAQTSGGTASFGSGAKSAQSHKRK